MESDRVFQGSRQWGDQITETMGPYMAIDPNNSSIVYVGTPSALVICIDERGCTWSL